MNYIKYHINIRRQPRLKKHILLEQADPHNLIESFSKSSPRNYRHFEDYSEGSGYTYSRAVDGNKPELRDIYRIPGSKIAEMTPKNIKSITTDHLAIPRFTAFLDLLKELSNFVSIDEILLFKAMLGDQKMYGDCYYFYVFFENRTNMLVFQSERFNPLTINELKRTRLAFVSKKNNGTIDFKKLPVSRLREIDKIIQLINLDSLQSIKTMLRNNINRDTLYSVYFTEDVT